MKRNASVAILLLVVAFAAAAWGGASGPKILYRIEGNEGHPVSVEGMNRTVTVLEQRFKEAGFAGIEVSGSVSDGKVTVSLPEELTPRLETICALAERPGRLEFRIRAEAAEERKQRELFEASGGMIKPPTGFMWIPQKGGGSNVLVCTPERPLQVEVDKLSKKGVAADSAEMKAAVAKRDEAFRDSVFRGSELAAAKAQRQAARWVVLFEFQRDRKPFFEAFTEKHVGESLAIILDGEVETAPVLKSKLPGMGVIDGAGEAGFTEEEAKSLAAVLTSGGLTYHLARMAAPEKK